MFALKLWFLAAVVVYLGNNSVYASLSVEEQTTIKKALEPIFIECLSEFDVTQDEIMEKKKSGNEADIDPCLINCFFKKVGFIDNNAMFDVDKAMEITKTYVKSEEDLKIFDNIGQNCAKVNDEEVSDADKGCERAMLLFKCFKEHKHEINLDQL